MQNTKRFLSILLFFAAALTVFSLGYWAGGNYYKGLLLTEQANRAKEEEVRLRQIVDVQVQAQKRLLTQALQTNLLIVELDESKKQLAKERKDFNRRLQHAANSALTTCTGLPDDWVRLYNEGLYGTDNQHGTQSATTHNSIADETRTIDARIQQREPLNPLASPEDVLAHIRDYGQFCRDLESRFLMQTQLVKEAYE